MFLTGHGGGAELACTAMNIVLMNFGFLVFGVTDYIDKITTLHYGACVAKSPRNENDKEVCRVLGLRLAECETKFRHLDSSSPCVSPSESVLLF